MTRQLETKQHFGIRKLTTGAASVLLATTFLMTSHEQTVHADAIDDNTNHDQAENHDQLPENDTKDFATQSENDTQQNQDEQQTDAQNKNIENINDQQKASVKMEAQTMSVKVHYTDETGKEVASETVTGKQGDNIKFTLPKGYQAVNPDILKQTFEDQLEITIPISKLVHETSDKREWSPSSDNRSNVDKTIKNTKHDDNVTNINNNVNNQSNDAQAELSSNSSTSADNNKNQSANTLTNSQNALTENKNKIKYAINNPVDKQANIAFKTSKLKVVDSVANMHKIGTVDERANEKLFETSLIQLAAVEKSNSSINKTMVPNQLDQSIFLEGTKWTPAGWTRANPQFVAKKAHLDFAFVDHDQWNGRDWFVHYVNQKHAPTITATLRKEDIHKGNQILLAAIQSVKDNQQTNDQINLVDSGYMGAGGTDVYLKDQRIGHIYALNHDLGEVDYYLSIDTNIKVASDPEISWTDKSPVSLVGYYLNRVYHNGIDLGNDWPLFAKNIGSTYHVITSNGIQDIPFIATPNSGSKLPDNGNYKSNYIDPACPGAYFGGAVYSNLDPNKTQMGVFKMTSSENLINFNGQPGIAIRTRYNDVYNDKFYPSTNPSDNSSNPNPWLHLPATKKADNLSNIELLNQTPNDSITYSKTNNGYLVAYKFSPKLLATKGEAYVRPITEYGYDTNISLKDANRDDVIKQTLDYYRQRDFVPSSIDFLVSVPTTRGDKNDILTVSDITPNFNGQTSISNHNSNNSSLDAALYRSIPIQYIDIDNNNAIVGNDTIIGITDQDLTVTPFNLSIPKNYVAQNWDKIDYGVVHDKNNRTLVIPVKHKIIGTASNLKENANSGRDYELDRIRNEDFNNLINDSQTNAQYQGYSQNIHIIEDPIQIIEANADDQQSIDNAFDKINQDYSNQAKTINDQVTDYVQKMNNYVQKRKAFIQKLKNEGLWQEGMVDPESVKQSFHLNLDSHNNSIVPKVIWYDRNKIKLDSPQQISFLTDDAITGAFATVEYTGIQNSYYRNTPITKMTVTYSNVKPGTKSIGSWLTIRTGINNGLSYGHITGLDLDIKFYDENGNQITFDNDAYISVGSLNGYNNEATESVKLLSNGTILPMPQSAVRIHKDGSAYMDDGYVTPASIGLPDSFNSWDNSTDPNRIFGTALVHFQGNHLKLRAFKQMDNVLNTNNSQRTFNGTPWFIWSTMLPPLSFNEPKPELTIHYHNDKLDEHLKRNYSINENLPTPADYNDKYTNVYGHNTNKLSYDLNLSRTEAKDLVTNQKQSASWVLPHFYAQDNQGNIHDLGQGVYSKNPTNGQWGFWNIFDKYQNSQYNVNPNQFLSPAGKGIITLPGYKLTTNNDHNSEAATKFDNQSSWIIYNLNGENGISKLENLITNIDLQPTTHVNNIDVIDLDSKNQKSSFADKIKPIYTDTTDSISVADNNLINLDNNLKNYYQRMLENKIIDHIQINDNIIYFNYENGNWLIKSTKWGNLSLTDFEKKAQQEHLNLRNFNLKPVTTSDGIKAGLNSQITVADQNILTNGQWQTDVPDIQIYVKNKVKRPAEEYDNTDTINHHYIIHYQIPKQIQDDVQYDNGDVYYDIMAHHEYYTYSYLDTNCNYWSDPIYGTLPDGSFGVVGYTDPVPHPEEKWATEDLGWIEDDDPNNNANYIGVDDLLSSDLNNAPFVVDNTDTSNIVDNYQLHIYGVNNLGQKIDLTNGSHLITQNGKLYFAPYYNKVNGQKDPYLSTKLDDSEFGNDIWVTYEPLATQRQITYVDIHDYDEPKTLKSYYVTGKEGDQTHLNIVPNTPAGYEIDDDQELPPNDYTFNYETDGDPIIVYVHAKEQIDNNVSPFTRHVIFDTTQMAPEDRNKDIYINWNNDSTSVSSFHNYDKQADADLVFNYKGHINPITNEHTGNWSVNTTNNDNQLLKAGIDPKSKGQELINLLEGSIHVPDGYYAYLDDPSESVTSIPANTLDHLITNSNLIIHIAPIGRNTQIKYVDSLTNETVATGKIITGNLGDKYQTDLTLPDHYSLIKQQTDTNVKITSFTTPQAIITVNKSAQAVIYVNADVIYVDHHNPKKPDDIMITDPDVPEITTNYPVGVDDDYLNKYINETIEFHYPDGSAESKQQKVHFYRNALINLVTGEITYVDNDRKVLLNDQWAIEGPNNFKDVLIPTKAGMMPKAHIVSGKPGQISLTKISGLTPHVTDDDIKVVIDYSQVNNYKTIVLVDDDATMREITRFNINGNTSFNIPDGYLLANSYNNDERNEIMNGDWDSLSNATNNGNPDLITIHLIENMKNITDTDAKAHLNIKRQVVIVNPDNTRDSMTMTIELERQAIYNEITKKTSYGNWYVKQIPVTTYDHTLDNGEDEDSGIENFDLYNYKYDKELDNPSTVNMQILKYFGDYENVNNFIKQLNNHTELIIPAIHIPDKAGYAKEIDNANTDGINISNEYIPAEHLLLVNDQNEKDQLGTETQDLSIINIDDHNFDENLDKTIVIHYIQGQHEMSYHYIDQITGQIVGGDSVLGDEGQTVDIINTIPDGYHLVSGQHNFANTYTFDNKNNVTQTVYVTKD